VILFSKRKNSIKRIHNWMIVS